MIILDKNSSYSFLLLLACEYSRVGLLLLPACRPTVYSATEPGLEIPKTVERVWEQCSFADSTWRTSRPKNREVTGAEILLLFLTQRISE